MYKLFIAIIIFELAACDQPQSKAETKTMDFGAFTIETPKSWAAIKETGIDSYVGRIAIDEDDTLNFNLGWYSNTLYEYDPMILDSSMIRSIDTSLIASNVAIFVADRRRVDPDRFRKNNVIWDTIDGRQAKIVYPRRSGTGITGVYFDTLWVSHSDIERFNLYGENLSLENEKKLLQALRTLKFRKK